MSVRNRICVSGGSWHWSQWCLSAVAPTSPDALVASAKEYLAKNDRNAAVIQLKNALQKNPDLAEARFLLGKALLETGEIAGGGEGAAQGRGAQVSRRPSCSVAGAGAGDAWRLQEGHRRVCQRRCHDAGGQGRPADDARAGATWQRATSKLPAPRSPRRLPPFRIIRRRCSARRALRRHRRSRRRAGARRNGAGQVAELADGWQLKGDIVSAQRQRRRALAAYRKAWRCSPTTWRRIRAS